METHYVVSQGNMVLPNSSNLNMAHMELTIDVCDALLPISCKTKLDPSHTSILKSSWFRCSRGGDQTINGSPIILILFKLPRDFDYRRCATLFQPQNHYTPKGTESPAHSAVCVQFFVPWYHVPNFKILHWELQHLMRSAIRAAKRYTDSELGITPRLIAASQLLL